MSYPKRPRRDAYNALRCPAVVSLARYLNATSHAYMPLTGQD